MRKKGFMIVELVIVIAVIAILAAVLIPAFSNIISKANESAALQTARNTLSSTIPMSPSGSLPDETVISVYYSESVYNFIYEEGSLTSVTYEGTTAQWASITKGTGYPPATVTSVTCTDGTVTIQ